MVDIVFTIKCIQPFFSCICFLFIERQINAIVVFFIQIFKIDSMLINVGKIFFCFFICRCSEPFIVFCLPQMRVLGRNLPFFEIMKTKKRNRLLSFSNLNNRSNKLFQKSFHLIQARPKILYKINKQALYMRTIMILICHNSNRPISQTLRIRISLIQF